jgi:hypothetical protein
MWDYNKTEESNMQQQNIIIGLEQTYQELREQQIVAHIEFEKEKNSNYPNLGLEKLV